MNDFMNKQNRDVRAFKLKKYDEITVNGDIIKDKLPIGTYLIIGLNLACDSNIFYGYNTSLKQYEYITEPYNFDNYVCVVRLLNWNKEGGLEKYYFRILKFNANEIVDFEEEKKYLKSFIQIEEPRKEYSRIIKLCANCKNEKCKMYKSNSAASTQFMCDNWL